MRKLTLLLAAGLSLALVACGQESEKVYADGHTDADHERLEAQGKKSGHHDDHGDHAHGPSSIRAEIVSGSVSGEGPQRVTLRLTDTKTGAPLGPDDIDIAHTKKVHLLIIDESLSDYHHIHPEPGQNTGEWVFDFTPRFARDYRVWVDIVPEGGAQQYAATLIDAGNETAPSPSAETLAQVTVDGLNFSLTFNGPLKAGEDVMGSVAITDAATDTPFTQLEPIMGAFGHIVAFAGDWDSIEHVHPRGVEPSSADERSGPVLSFHMKPAKPGVMKVFVQTQVSGEDVFAPFTASVE